MYKINKQKRYIVELKELYESGNLSCSVVSDFYNLVDCSPPVSSAHGILQARILEQQPFPLLGDLSDPRIESRVSCIANRFFTVNLQNTMFRHCQFKFFFHILFFLMHKNSIFGSNCFYFFVLRHYVVSGRKSVSKKKQGSEKGI